MSSSVDSTYLQGLNPVQREAVMHTEGPALVVAGPGSGKTRVLTFRIAHLIQEGVKPWSILSLTFTNKAAREMKERIERVVGPPAKQVWAGTFHSIFARILRVEADKIGYPSNFTIYDADDSRSLIATIIKEMNLDKNVYNPNSIRARISSAKSNLVTPKLYADDAQLRQQDKMAKRPYTAEIYTKYVGRCKQAGAMDFDDLLYRLYELLQANPDMVLEKYREKFQHVLVDEFQDTNYLQYAIVRRLVHFEGSPRNICVVGDDAQSIYAFRGATIQNILDFEKDFKPYGIKVFKLEQNYRSTEHIVRAANEVITYNRKQIQKRIWSDKGGGQKIKLIKAMTDNEEGKRIADTILEQKNRHHLSNSDIAILYRTNAQSRIFEEYLRRYNITYRVFGGQSFYQRKEVKDMIAYLRLAVNPQDEEALRRVINLPRRGIGQSTMDKIAQYAAQNDMSLWESLTRAPIGGRAGRSLADFKNLVEEARRRAAEKDAFEVATFLARQSGLQALLKQDTTIEGMGRLDNFNALLDGISSFVEEDSVFETEGLPDKSLAVYLQNIALLTDFDTEDAEGDYVSLMSTHSAKGLEFPSVFVVGLEEKLFPSYLAMENDDGLDEERRLFYVAITRAERHLTLSYAYSRYRHGSMRYNEPSRFIQEIPVDSLISTGSARKEASSDAGPSAARVQGHFRRARPAKPVFQGDLADFQPSPAEKIQAGMQVMHLKFGKGKVLSIDGGKGSRVATIFFEQIENPQRRIMLRFAKLQILD